MILIDKIDLAINSGLCVLTGETGAGKSMILESLSLLTGNRAKSSLKPEKGKSIVITALIDISHFDQVKQKLSILELNFDNEIIVKRIIRDNGKSKCFINDEIVTVATLKDIFNHIIEIHSQFSEQGLLDSKTHINILDDYGNYKEELHELKNVWKDLTNLRYELTQLKNDVEDQQNNYDNAEFDLKELKILDPKPNEFKELVKKKTILQNSAKISECLKEVKSNFFSENPPGIDILLSQSIKSLQKIANLLDEDSQKKIESLNNIYFDSQEIFQNFLNMLNQDFDVNSLEKVDDRIQLYKKISKKHNIEENNLNILFDKLLLKLDSSQEIKKELKIKEEKYNLLNSRYNEIALQIHSLRKAHAIKLDQEINNELVPLKLENAKFKTFCENCEANERGIDKVIFKIQTNPKSEMGLIKNISSGGELCRIALAIKVIAQKNNKTVMVFDEVDSGIGGAVSSAVGERLKKLGDSRQVLVVTHSPQVAAFGNDHFIVKKTYNKDDVQIDVKKINVNEKVFEVARMLSGKNVTDEAISAAKRLIEY